MKPFEPSVIFIKCRVIKNILQLHKPVVCIETMKVNDIRISQILKIEDSETAHEDNKHVDLSSGARHPSFHYQC